MMLYYIIPQNIKIVRVIAAHEHIRTIENNYMNLFAARMALGCGRQQNLIISTDTCDTFSQYEYFERFLLKF